MCGIAGYVRLDGGPVDLELLVRMTRTLEHRGPDEEGYFVNRPRDALGAHGKFSVLIEIIVGVCPNIIWKTGYQKGVSQ